MSRVLITGGTGTLGTAITRFLVSERNTSLERICIYSRDELKQAQMRETIDDPDDRIRFFLGDVRDEHRLRMAMRNGVTHVIHTAALKRIDATEYDPMEAVKTNVTGTMNVINAILETPSVAHAVLVSTDKACDPVNLYGSTKLTAERLWIAANAYVGSGMTRLNVVRYGNVARSRGSVIPSWEDQIRRGIVPRVTHPDMTRFWMTVDDAVQLVLYGSRSMSRGAIYVPKLRTFRVVDLWRAMIAETGEPEISGIRPGEKIHETLISESEVPRTSDLGGMNMYVILNGSDLYGARSVDGPVRSSDPSRRMTVEEIKNLIR